MSLIKLKYLLIILIIGSSIFQIKKLITNIQTSEFYFINCDEQFSRETRHQIVDFINESLKRKTPEEFFKILKAKFPIIKSIIMHKKNPDLISITIHGYKPLYKINNNLIATDDLTMHPFKIFSEKFINKLEQITTQEGTDNSNFLQFINKLEDIPQRYKVEWKKENLILLEDKEDKRLLFLIKYDSIPNRSILNICKRIKDEKQTKNACVVDLRFDNQIIISKN